MNHHTPPIILERILAFFLHPDHASLLGDMAEEFAWNAEKRSPLQASLIYFYQGVRLIPLIIYNTIIWSGIMLQNYFLITARIMKRYKGFTAINLLGLAASMSICLLIILFMKEQINYEQFHSKRERIYRAVSTIHWQLSGNTSSFATSPASLSDILQEEFPDVENAVKIYETGNSIVYNNTSFPVRCIFTEPEYFQIFDFPLQQGDPAQALENPGNIILSLTTAEKFFPDDDALGKLITLEGIGEFVVAGVLADPPGKSHLSFDAIAAYSTLAGLTQFQKTFTAWEKNFFSSYNYFLLREGASRDNLDAQLASIHKRHFSRENRNYKLDNLRSEALLDINLGEVHGNMLGRPTPSIMVYIFLALGTLIMLTACFNYMSLSIARSLKRAREVGMRKVMGAHRSQIIRQFLSESFFTAILSLGLAILFLNWLIPGFNSLWGVVDLNVQIQFDFFQDWDVYLYFFLFSLFIGLIAGFYPAIYLSGFLPVKVLKGLKTNKGFSGLTLRKLLTISQFSLSLIFVISSIVIFRQSNHILEADYGFNTEAMIALNLQNTNYEVFKNELASNPDIAQITGTNLMPLSGQISVVTIQPGEEKQSVNATTYRVDHNFLESLGLTLLTGRTFSEDISSDQKNKIIVNESAVKEWGLGDPYSAIGQTFLNISDSLMLEVIGVVKNYNINLATRNVDPIMLVNDPARINFAMVYVMPGKTAQVTDALEKVWQKLDPIHPIRYVPFGGETIGFLRSIFRDIIYISGLTGLLAVIIASLGLLAMTSYSIENRLKEVGIRKVLGASVVSVVVLLSRDFVKLLLISIVIATPIAWMLNNFWLQEMAQQITIDLPLILLGIVPVLLIGVIAVVSQTLRAALDNPINTLRHE